MDVKIFKNIDQISEELTSQLYQLINQSGKNQINIALSGGSTPLKFYKYLAQTKFDIRWSGVHLFWGDERCVPPDHEESNFGQVNDTLFSKIDIPSENIHRIHGEKNPQIEFQRYKNQIKKFVVINKNGWPEFDWILLGMGDDGHTASIFPDTSGVDDYESICLRAKHPQTGQERITLGLKVINQARRVSFLVTGKSKADLLSRILNRDEAVLNLPAAKINPESGQLEWLLDEDAANIIAPS